MDSSDIAIIGMALRVPGADTPESFWQLILTGLRHRVLDGIEDFDADFFDCAAEATFLDPQHRLFLECAYHAVERAGYVDQEVVTGLYGSANLSRYLLDHVYPRLSSTEALLGNIPDGFAARVAYELDLQGPVMNVQAACASSLVAVHLACQDLLSHQCDLALAGGASIVPGAEGNGAGVVVLKRLDEAVRDSDHVHAVIRGSAVANDGRRRRTPNGIGTAGARTAAVTALAIAGVDPVDVGYLEPHALDDELEVATLRDVYGDVHLGSVKPLIGHLVQAAGVVGLIGAALVVEHGRVPGELFGARHAGVAASGSGGVHAHVVLGQAPSRPETPRTGWHLLQVSARTERALAESVHQMSTFWPDPKDPPPPFFDVAHTLRHGRRDFRTRAFAVVQDGASVAFTGPFEVVDNAAVVLRFSGPDTARDIATARGLLTTGITPALVLGLGLGEYAAAAVAGVLTDEEAISLVTRRRCPERYAKQIANAVPRAPQIPLLSGATGALLTELDVTDSRHWLALAEDLCPAVPELPGNAVTVDISQDCGERGVLIALGTLWARGVPLPDFRPGRRVPLPGYPFQRQRHWLEPLR
uniref:beta-ketoacyl synthase N-terminal-like domain-containing protein n=1 Tax=Lentzea alba TaxID=2714351 RepID=UPI0039BF55E6